MQTEGNESSERNSKQPGDLCRFNGHVGDPGEEKKSEVTPKVEDYDSDDSDDDSVPPNCERQQFASYVMSAIIDLPESRAEIAMQAIKLFLKKWHGCAADK